MLAPATSLRRMRDEEEEVGDRLNNSTKIGAMMKTGMSVTPHTVERTPSYKMKDIMLARVSIDSAFENYSRDNDFDSTYM